MGWGIRGGAQIGHGCSVTAFRSCVGSRMAPVKDNSAFTYRVEEKCDWMLGYGST